MENNTPLGPDAQGDAAGTVFSPEIGEIVSKADAVREKIRLYPHATAQEIAAMFEVDGDTISALLVREIKQEMLGKNA